MKKIWLLTTLLFASVLLVLLVWLNWNFTNAKETKSDVFEPYYSQEFQDAYNFAYMNGITAMDTIEKANMNWYITRAELSKMMVQYIDNVLKKEIAYNDIMANYSDVNVSLWDLDYYIQKAFAYKIMWINNDGTPLKEFRPNDTVSRAEFGTVLSRVLWWDKNEWWNNYYENHLKALQNEKIMINISNPSEKEKRWYVMLMLMRATLWDNKISWDDAKQMIMKWEVVSVAQSHNLDVEIKSNWKTYYTVEPKIDEVFDIISQCWESCKNIVMVTE